MRMGGDAIGKHYAVDRGSSGAWRFVARESGGDNFRVARRSSIMHRTDTKVAINVRLPDITTPFAGKQGDCGSSALTLGMPTVRAPRLAITDPRGNLLSPRRFSGTICREVLVTTVAVQ